MDVSVAGNLSWASKTKSVPEICEAGEAMKVPEDSIVTLAQKKDVIALDIAASDTIAASLTSISDVSISEVLENSYLLSCFGDIITQLHFSFM